MTNTQASPNTKPKERSFSRISPASFAEKVGIPMGWFVVSHHFMPDKAERRRAHGCWYKISCETREIYRILRFSPRLKAPTGHAGEIVIDWIGWLDLNDREQELDRVLNLTIEPVQWWKIPVMAMHHPDPTHRLAGSLALVSIGLGILSVVLALVL